MTRLVARVYDTAIRVLSRFAIGWTPNVDRDPLYDPGREFDDRPLDPRDVDLWALQIMSADDSDILREAAR